MTTITTIIDTLQADWPLLPSLGLVSSAEIPTWVSQSAQQLHARLSPKERLACQHQLPRLVAQLALLQRNWTVTVVLAILLALTVVATANPTFQDGLRTGILITVLSSILLPALAIYHGIACDHMAAQSLLVTIRPTKR